MPVERVGAVLVAAGRSTRMGLDKLWAQLGGRPVLTWSLDSLAASGALDGLALVVSRERVTEALRLLGRPGLPLMVVAGGERRRDSVAAGVDALVDHDWVLVHDAARPFVDRDLILRGLDAARETGAAVAGVPVRDTIKRVVGRDVIETLRREELWAVQTPQVFRRDLLSAALASSDEDVTDEAALVERMGNTVRVFPGEIANFKITTREDLSVARGLLRQRESGVGQG